MNKKEIITVQFNSHYKNNSDISNGNANYYIDWSAILKDNQPYLLNYSFIAERNLFVTNTKIALLYINIYGENYIASGIGRTVANQTNLLCALDVIGSLPSSGGYFYVNSNTKNQIFLNSRPTNNNVNIKVMNNDAIPIIWGESATPTTEISDYILTLTFSEI